MLKHYLLIATRNLWKNKAFSAINVFGLIIGFSSCLLIGAYIQNELRYDSFQLKGNRIARVIMEYSFSGNESKKGNFTSTKVAPTFKRNFPEIESAIRMIRYSEVVGYGEKMITEKAFMYADSTFFQMFSFPLVSGDSHSALSGPNKVLLTASTAKKYFGDIDPIGKMIRVGTDSSYFQVTGILADCPSNSQIKFDFLASFSSLNANQEQTYWDANYTTYFLLKDPQSIPSLQAKIPAFMKKEMQGQGATVNFYLEPFRKIHLYSEFAGFEPNSSITYIYILAAVALLILVIACFTYINLSTARSIERAREVGVRKVIGAGKSQLFWQFIGESFMICFISILISIGLAILLLPYFNSLTVTNLHPSAILSATFIASSILVTAFVSLLAGSYPALILAGFQPVKVLKGAFKNSGSGQVLRKSLIIFQFMISVFLIVSTFIIQRQLYFIQHTKLGFDRQQIVVLPLDSKMIEKLNTIKTEFKLNPAVVSVSRCQNTPVNIYGGYNMRTSVMPENEQIAVTANPVDEDFIKTTGLTILSGTDFSKQDISDVAEDMKDKKIYHFVINESAAKELGWSPEEAVGKRMFLDNSRPGFVRGVIKDFHFASLHEPIRSLVLFPEIRGHNLLVKIKGDNPSSTISYLGSKWKELVPNIPFEYRFLDEDYNKLYNAERRLGTMLNIFAGIAIVLACLGLFGLSAYSIQQRSKEIGIRKVLGAATASIGLLLSKDFIRLVIIAIIVAFPVSWWMMHNWLQGFAYRISMDWWIFVLAGLSALIIAILTVSIMAIKAASENPSKKLRSE